MVSQRTGLGRTSLYALIKDGKLKTVRVGRAIRVKEADLAEFINSMPERITITPSKTQG
jgi:excisionase family DNA binding protein